MHFLVISLIFHFVVASQHAFSVLDDLLAFPQYNVVISDSFVTEDFAQERIARAREQSAATDGHDAHGAAEQGVSKHTGAHGHGDGLRSGGDGDNDASEPDNTYEAMVLNGSRFLCRVPLVPQAQDIAAAAAAAAADGAEALNATEQALAAEAEAAELARATERGWELLQGMEGHCVYFMSGWWSYSFCYNGEVAQFHQLPPGRAGVPRWPPTPDPGVQSYVLGAFPEKWERGQKKLDSGSGVELGAKGRGGETGLARLETRGETRYLVQTLGGGTMCDLTRKERKIEVQFHCHPQAADHIHMIKETATCTYLMVINTARLCNDVAFLPSQKNRPHTIACQHVLAASEIPDYTASKLVEASRAEAAEKAAAATRAAEAKQAAAATATDDAADETAAGGSLLDYLLNPFDHAHHPRRPDRRAVIGGVEVGARQHVGTEGKVIEKSVVVGGKGKETLLGVLATSDGSTMDERQMRKLDVYDPKKTRELKKEMQRMAKGREWRLELVDTAQGREYRGIIDRDDDEEDEETKGKEKAKGQKKGGRGRPETTGHDRQKGKPTAGKDEGGRQGDDGSEETYKDEL